MDGVDLEIEAGESVAIVGPSGAGKTTLLRVLGAAQALDSGTARVGGRALESVTPRELRELRARIGFVFQSGGLLPNLRVSQNVIAGKLGQRGALARLRSMLLPSRPDLEAAHALLEELGIGPLLFQRAEKLSGGEAQRVAIARALFQEPAALVADEPVAAVDPARSRDLLEKVIGLSRKAGSTLVVSMHDVELALALFRRVVGLRNGRVAFDRPAEELSAPALDELFALGEVR